MTDINAYVPANIYDFYRIIQGFSQLNFIPTEKIFELIADQQDYISDPQNFYKELGPFIIVLLVGCVILIVLVIVKVYIVVFCCLSNARLKRVYMILKNYLFWIATLRYILESYLKMTLYSITISRTGLNWSSNVKKAQSVFALV
jgi:hypothetical protein